MNYRESRAQILVQARLMYTSPDDLLHKSTQKILRNFSALVTDRAQDPSIEGWLVGRCLPLDIRLRRDSSQLINDLIVNRLPRRQMRLEIQKDELRVTVGKVLKLSPIGAAIGHLLSKLMMDLQIQQDSCFLALVIFEKLHTRKLRP
jgi:hypothetical protein